jgi:hypothetical protein
MKSILSESIDLLISIVVNSLIQIPVCKLAFALKRYSLFLRPSGIREPHWHPNAAELNYVVEGTAKMIILSPGGTVDSLK